MTDRADRDVILRGIAAIARNVLAIVHELRQNDKDRDALALAQKAYDARRAHLGALAATAREARVKRWESRAPRHSQR